jgi:hypothetical protein
MLKVGQSIGASGAICTGIQATPKREKPSSHYHDGLKAPRRGGGKTELNCNRPFSTGFGPSKAQVDESIPKMTRDQRHLLLAIEEGRTFGMSKLNPIAKELGKMGLVTWSAKTDVWVTMADGRRVAELLLEQAKK